MDVPFLRCGVGRRVTVLLGAVLAFALSVKIESCVAHARFDARMRAAGFPADLAERLADLHLRHRAWTFTPLPVTDLSWREVVARECAPAVNLVVFSDWAPEPWRRLGAANYRPYYAPEARAYDSGAWYQASREAVAYFLDVRNFLNERDVFQFETLEYEERSQTCEAVERTLAGTFMAGACPDGGTRTYAELVTDIGRRLGVSPVFLAGRLASEQGAGSVQASGTIGDSLVGLFTNAADRVGNAVVWGRTYARDAAATSNVVAKGAAAYNGIYNFFNIGACGSGLFEIRYNAWREAVSAETCARYGGPWNTQARAIEGGAIRIRERYIDTFRHTRYLQKFSVAREAGVFRWKQYMQNIAAPLAEARNAFRAYSEAGSLEAPYRFVIPVYRDAPAEPCADPANGNSVYSPSR